MSDLVVWVYGGIEAKDRYFRQREEVHENIPSFRGSGYGGCFHDGVEILDVVREMHNSIREQTKRHGDRATAAIIELIETKMLLGLARDRLSATRIRAILEGEFENDDPGLESSGSTHEGSIGIKSTEIFDKDTNANLQLPQKEPQQPPEILHESTPLSRQPTIMEVEGYFQAKGRRESVEQEIETSIEHLKHNLHGRHQFFFIDDSRTMKQHASSVTQGLRAMVPIASQLNPSRVWLSFASESWNLHKAWGWNHRKLIQAAERHKYESYPGLMESHLSSLIDDIIIPHLPYRRVLGTNFNPRAWKNLSLYIFTDGKWGCDTDRAAGVRDPIERLMNKMRSRHLPRTCVSIHFVRFGDDPAGVKNLQHLDDFGRAEHLYVFPIFSLLESLLKYQCRSDICDAKPFSSPIKAIFTGPITRHNDNDDDGDVTSDMSKGRES
jgi:hypothetical protein